MAPRAVINVLGLSCKTPIPLDAREALNNYYFSPQRHEERKGFCTKIVFLSSRPLRLCGGYSFIQSFPREALNKYPKTISHRKGAKSAKVFLYKNPCFSLRPLRLCGEYSLNQRFPREALNKFSNTISHRKDANSAKVFLDKTIAFLCALRVFAVNYHQRFLAQIALSRQTQ